jgi:all-beta uncharacterized protein
MRYHRLLLASLVAAIAALAAAACSKNDSSPSSSCAVTVGAVTTNVSAAASTGSIPVTSSCAWTAASSASFITISSGSTGSGNGTVNYSIAANTGAIRSGSIAIGNAIVSFTQSGALAPVGCTVTLSATTAKINSNGGTVNIDVTAASTCGWTATSNASFLTATANATGNGTVAITASANNGPPRTGTVTIGGQTVTVTQDGGIFASFSLFDPGQTAGETNVCQFRSASSASTTCLLRSTSFTTGAAPIVNFEWSVQYTYGTVKVTNVSSDSPTLSITDTCGLAGGGSTDDGVLQPLDVTLTVTDSLGNKSTAKSGTGNQQKLFVQLFNCGV